MDHDALLNDELVSVAFAKDKGSNTKLDSWSLEPGTSSGNNFFNVIKRIKVKYTEDNVENFTSYIAKVNPCKPNDAFNPYRQRAVLKEVFFYDTLVPLLNVELHKMGEGPLKVPKYLHSCTEAEKEVIIFEDLDLRRFKIFEWKYPMDDAHSKIMATELSRLHAAGFALQKNYTEDLGKVFPLLIESWHCPELNLREAFDKVFQKGILLNISLIKALGGYEYLLPWLESLTTREMETIRMEMESNPPWRGICHGDYHRTNVLFKYDHAMNPIDIMIIDWQTVRMEHIASEIEFLVYSSFTLSEERFPLAINTYTEKFRQIFGPETFFTADTLLKEVDLNQSGILYCFYMIPLSMCVSNPSEFYKVDRDELKKFTGEEAYDKAKGFLENIPLLSSILIDYLEEIKRKNINK